MAYQAGKQLGNYRIIPTLSQGAMGTTYLAEHVLHGQQVSIKVFPSSSKEQLQLLERKAPLLARLKHPNILRTFDFGIDDGTFYLVNEYAPNGTLRERHPRGSLVPLDTVISYVKQVAGALQYAHNFGIIHRDVKPDYMFVGYNNDVLLGDFGIAIINSASSESERVAGTPAYMAPEQFQGLPVLASDQYALGVVVYEWLSGSVPFRGSLNELIMKQVLEPPPSLRAIVPTISRDVEQVVMKALAKNPEDRFTSIQAFANALEAASRPPTEGYLSPPPLIGAPGTRAYSPAADDEDDTMYLAMAEDLTVAAAPPLYDEDDTTYSGLPAPYAPGTSLSDPYTPQQSAESPPSTLSLPQSAPPRGPGLSPSFFTEAGDALAKFFSGSGRKKQPEKTQLSLFAIARTTLEADDRAIIGKTYTVQAGISQNRPEDFRGEPFTVSVQNPFEPLLFHILLHPSGNIELIGAWYQPLRYDPRNMQSQLISCSFRLKAPGRSYLLINFYRERQWLKTIRFEFDGIEQSLPSTAMRGR